MAWRRFARLLLILALCVTGALAQAATAGAVEQLPDLMEEVPSSVSIYSSTSDAGTQYQLIFGSGARNIGDGPLRIDGSRPSTSRPTMVANQTVNNTDGTTTVYPNVGTMQFVTSATHNHWHYLAFERYELRRTDDYSLVSPDHKTGFCLTDSYRDPDGPPPGAPASPVYTGNCNPGQPNALSVSEGISVGYGDMYIPQKEGQYVDVTGVAAGQYYLVHRANPDRKVLEKRYDNNDATLLIRLAWPSGNAGAPTVTELKRCYGQSCPMTTAPPAVTTGSASSIGQTTAKLGGSVSPNGVDGSYRFDYGTTSTLGKSTATTAIDPTTDAQAASASLTGLAGGTTYYYRLVGTNKAGVVNGDTHTFTTASAPPPPPTAATGAATPSGTTAASLAGTVNPRGGTTSWFFQYGTTESYGATTPTRDAGAAAGDQQVSEQIGSLTADTTYHYRLVAASAAGTAYGSDLTFKTPAVGPPPPPPQPAAVTGAADAIDAHSAAVHGSVDPNGAAATFRFEYGLSSAYGAATPYASAGAGGSPLAVSATLSLLLPGTTYHYRLVAVGSGTPVAGADATFVTPSAAPPEGAPADPVPQPDPLPQPQPQPEPAPQPSNEFYVRRLRSTADGAALLRLDLPGAGEVSVAAVARLGRDGALAPVGSIVYRAAAGGPVSLRLMPNRRAYARMRSGRGLRVSLKVRYAPPGVDPRTLHLRLSLRRAHR